MTSLYDMSIPVYIKALESMIGVLKKGEKWADENKIDHSKLVEARLAPDMNPLAFQVQTASNTSKSILSRVAGRDNPNMEDNEKTFAEFYERLQKTIDALKTAKREDFEGKEGMEVSLFNGQAKFTALEYLQVFGLPNFFFVSCPFGEAHWNPLHFLADAEKHVTTAYDILRKEGVPVGKRDFIGL